MLRFLTNLYLAGAVLTGVPFGLGSTVICVASNGHLAIEVGQDRCAECPPGASSSLGNDGVDEASDPCGPCVDLPMGRSALREARHVLIVRGDAASPPMPILWAATRLDASHEAGSVSHSVEPALGASFPPTRTTILRN